MATWRSGTHALPAASAAGVAGAEGVEVEDGGDGDGAGPVTPMGPVGAGAAARTRHPHTIMSAGFRNALDPKRPHAYAGRSERAWSASPESRPTWIACNPKHPVSRLAEPAPYQTCRPFTDLVRSDHQDRVPWRSNLEAECCERGRTQAHRVSPAPPHGGPLSWPCAMERTAVDGRPHDRVVQRQDGEPREPRLVRDGRPRDVSAVRQDRLPVHQAVVEEGKLAETVLETTWKHVETRETGWGSATRPGQTTAVNHGHAVKRTYRNTSPSRVTLARYPSRMNARPGCRCKHLARHWLARL